MRICVSEIWASPFGGRLIGCVNDPVCSWDWEMLYVEIRMHSEGLGALRSPSQVIHQLMTVTYSTSLGSLSIPMTMQMKTFYPEHFGPLQPYEKFAVVMSSSLPVRDRP